MGFWSAAARGALGLSRNEAKPATMSAPTTSKKYPTSIVGERSYQPAIGRCREGEPVTLMLEPDNPYDGDAIAVVSKRGETIGYLGRDNWLRAPVLEEGKGCTATIAKILPGDKAIRGVVLDAAVCAGPLASRNFKR